jgi:hypothetical protein
MVANISEYNDLQEGVFKNICDLLKNEIDKGLPSAESKIWHGHPVWFDNGNPLVGYAKRKNDVQLLFWSGQTFEEPTLEIEGTFKAAQMRYIDSKQINKQDLARWLKKAHEIQWDYKNIVKKKGVLERLK